MGIANPAVHKDYLLITLTDNGHGEALYDVVAATTYPGWGYMIAEGATTIWENWSEKPSSWGIDGAGAESMIMWATVDQFFYNDLAGIKGPKFYSSDPTPPGFQEITIDPLIPEKLASAGARIKTVRGEISSKWQRSDDELILEVEIPTGASATVRVPVLKWEQPSIYESQNIVWEKGVFLPGTEGISGAADESGAVAFKIGSGSYRFAVFDSKQFSIQELREMAGEREWKPFSRNPVVSPGPPDSWESWNVATMNILQVGDLYHMYYEGGSIGVEDYQIGHAVSSDGVTWAKDQSSPVIPFGDAGDWDDRETWDPFVIFEDGIFKMWYGGTTITSDRRDFQLGYATSQDGANFENRIKISDFPADINIADMHVVHDLSRGIYRLFYLSRKGDYWGLFFADSKNETDFDFAHARRLRIEDETGDYRCPHVVAEDGVWYMFYGYKYEPRSGLAISSDGENWKTVNPTMFDGHDPEVMKIADNLYLLFYGPSKYDMGHKPGCDIRVALLNGKLSDLARQ